MYKTGLVEANAFGNRMVALRLNPELTSEPNHIPVYFVHGLGSTTSFWHPNLFPELMRLGPAYSLSLPGHYPAVFPNLVKKGDLADSLFVELFVAILNQLDVNKPGIFIAHAEGFYPVALLTLHHPELIKAIVNISGGADYTQQTGGWLSWLRYFSRYNSFLPDYIVNLLTLPMRSEANFIGRYSKLISKSTGVNPDMYLHQLHRDLLKLDAYSMRVFAYGLNDWSVAGSLSKIQTPILSVFGRNDHILNQKWHTKLLGKQLPNHQLITLPETGHWPHLERPRETRKAIVTFLTLLGINTLSGEY